MILWSLVLIEFYFIFIRYAVRPTPHDTDFNDVYFLNNLLKKNSKLNLIYGTLECKSRRVPHTLFNAISRLIDWITAFAVLIVCIIYTATQNDVFIKPGVYVFVAGFVASAIIQIIDISRIHDAKKEDDLLRKVDRSRIRDQIRKEWPDFYK